MKNVFILVLIITIIVPAFADCLTINSNFVNVYKYYNSYRPDEVVGVVRSGESYAIYAHKTDELVGLRLKIKLINGEVGWVGSIYCDSDLSFKDKISKIITTNDDTNEGAYLLNNAPLMGEAYLFKHSSEVNGPIRQGYIYYFSFMEAMQKLQGGYLIAVSPEFPGYYDAAEYGGYKLAYLQTKEKLTQNERIPAFSGFCIGTYKYKNISGFDSEIPAFRELTKKEVNLRYGLMKKQQEEKTKEIESLPPLDILSHGEDTIYYDRRYSTGITGEVQNNTGRYVNVGQIDATFYDRDGNVLGAKTGYVYHLAVGGKKTFKEGIPMSVQGKYDHYDLKAKVKS